MYGNGFELWERYGYIKSIDYLRRISYKPMPEYTLLELINQSIQFLFIKWKGYGI